MSKSKKSGSREAIFFLDEESWVDSSGLSGIRPALSDGAVSQAVSEPLIPFGEDESSDFLPAHEDPSAVHPILVSMKFPVDRAPEPVPQPEPEHEPVRVPERDLIYRISGKRRQRRDPLGDDNLVWVARFLWLGSFTLGAGAALAVVALKSVAMSLVFSVIGLLTAISRMVVIIKYRRELSRQPKRANPLKEIERRHLLVPATCLACLVVTLLFGDREGFRRLFSGRDNGTQVLTEPLVTSVGESIRVRDLEVILDEYRMVEGPTKRGLEVMVTVANVNRNMKIADPEECLINPVLIDEHGNRYTMLSRETLRPLFQRSSASLYPGERRIWVLLFEPPVDEAKELTFKAHFAPVPGINTTFECRIHRTEAGAASTPVRTAE